MTDDVRVLAAVAEELGDLPGAAVGVGPVRAAIGAARALADRPARCVLIGTCGAYPGGPPVGSVVVARRVGLSGGIGDAGLGYVPLAPEPVETDAGMRLALGLPEVDVLTVEAVTTDPELTLRRAAQWQAEHMEAFAVALAAAAAGVPFVAVLAVSNEVGPQAHAQWRANRDRAEAAARDAVRAWMTGGR